MINLDVLELGKLEDIIQTMSIGQLNRFIVEQKAKGSDMVSMFEVERQNRFAYPMATFVLTVIGVSLSSRKVRGGTGLHIGVGIGLCFTYILVCKFAAEFAKSSTFFSPHPARLAARHILRLHRALPLQESAEIVRHPARK